MYGRQGRRRGELGLQTIEGICYTFVAVHVFFSFCLDPEMPHGLGVLARGERVLYDFESWHDESSRQKTLPLFHTSTENLFHAL